MIFKNNIGWYAGPNSVRHDFYINGPILEACDYNEMLQVLHTAQEHDVIYLHLNTPGGCFMSACQICDAIMQSKAGAVIACAEGEICSAGTMIFLACNGWNVSPFSTFMFHTSSSMQGGKLPDSLKSIKSHEEHLNRVCTLLYDPFFDAEEVDAIINHNQDCWLTPEEVNERLIAMTEKQTQEMEDMAKDVKAAQEADADAKIEEAVAARLLEMNDGAGATREVDKVDKKAKKPSVKRVHDYNE
ncbi:coil containing protein [Vibrio phage 1.081.O._10N.286.52.C2]|nr:coil containing protein [Vibrio phage 1.081.O._10N.286.52.C2]